MIKITVIGTLTIIPRIPQIEPQKARENKATSGLILSESPINLGSTIFPMIVWIVPKIKKMINGKLRSPNCRIANVAGKIATKNAPITGMKFSMKMTKDQSSGESTPKANNTIKQTEEETKLISVFNPM